MLRVGFTENVAYRGEFFVWFLATNMPLIMLLLWRSVAAEAPFGRFGTREFTAYFLVTQVVRLSTGSWVVWQMNFDAQSGALNARLMRPIHAFVAYTTEQVSSLPIRLTMAFPVAIVALVVVGPRGFSHDPVSWLIFPLTVFLAWALNFVCMLVIGTLALYLGSSRALSDMWLGGFFILSGYIMPLELFPPWLAHAVYLTPFPYILSFPVTTVLGLEPRQVMLTHLATQAAFVALVLALGVALWRAGTRRYEAYGG